MGYHTSRRDNKWWLSHYHNSIMKRELDLQFCNNILSPCADYFSFAQAIFQFSQDIPTVINHRAGYYFRGFVGEIPLSGSEDYRNIFSGEISRTINSFLPPPQWIDFYTLRGYVVVVRREKLFSEEGEVTVGFFPDWRISSEDDDIRQSENIETPPFCYRYHDQFIFL